MSHHNPISPTIVIQSHRGAGILSTDNTREAFELGWSLGVIPEADVRTTRDGVLVAFHDATLARLVEESRHNPELGAKSVAELPWTELASLDVGSWRGDEFAGHRVPRLSDIFALMKGKPRRELYLDLKAASLPALSQTVDDAGVGGQVILASSDYATLREWSSLRAESGNGGSRTLYWMGTWGKADEEPLRARFREMRSHNFSGITQIQIHAGLRLPLEKINRESIDPFTPSDAFFRAAAGELCEHGILLQSLPWGGASEAIYWKLLDLGVQSFATDHPDVTLRALRTWKPQNRLHPAPALPPPLPVSEALKEADETQALEIGDNALSKVASLFAAQFGANAKALVIADQNTLEAAGRIVDATLRASGITCARPFVFGCDVHASYDSVECLEAALRSSEDAVAVAVGSGTINDLAKLASRLCGRPYMAVATAASMDGYTAFGASITRHGHKQTFSCPAPRAVLADISVIAKAPPALGASGYADLLAKVTAGADWLVADALGLDPIDTTAWKIVQDGLRDALDDPAGIRSGNSTSLRKLTEGLILGGFAMQRTKTSRPASGAEHQFSHLWDMQHHEHHGASPSHGFKVGIGTLAVTALYDWLLNQWDVNALDIDACCAAWPQSAEAAATTHALSLTPAWNDELSAVARVELAAKWIPQDTLRRQLTQLCTVWPDLRERLRTQLLPFGEVKDRLRKVGAPCEPEQIGISRQRLRASFAQAQAIRRRFTVLDLALRTGVWPTAMAALFGERGLLAAHTDLRS